jgi:chorismate mutase
VIARARRLAAAPLAADQLARIFQAIVDETRAAEYEWLTDGAGDVR